MDFGLQLYRVPMAARLYKPMDMAGYLYAAAVRKRLEKFPRR